MNRTAALQRWDPDALADLEHERDVLLRELDELDTQLRAGELEPEQHALLNDELCVRVAEVLERIDGRVSARPARRRSRRERAIVIAGIVVVATTCGWLLASQLAPRSQPAVERTAESTVEARLDRLRTLVAERPDDVAARLSYARLLAQSQDLPGALEQCDAVAARDDTNVEALTYGGWLAVLTAQPGGLERIDRAIAADPSYPDAFALRGLTLMRAGDGAAAVEALEHYLELAPNGPLAADVQRVIDRLGGAP